MSHTGGELERRQENIPLPYVPGERTGDIARIIDWPELTARVRGRGRGIGVAGLILIAAQLIWKSLFLGHFYFWQDDFHFLELALGHSFTWSYLTYVGAGHLTPGLYAIAWATARISLYNWPLAATTTMIMVAAADLAALRLLRTLFGDRPAILIPLIIYLMTPLTMPDIRWWSAAIETIPLQIATFMALNAQVQYVRTNRFWHALAAAAWLLFGLFFFEKALVLPLLLVGITSGFLMDGPWLPAIGRCLVVYWRAWVLQVAVVVGYAFVLASSLHTSSVQPSIPGTADGVWAFVVEIVKDTFVPGAVGGPWQWFPDPTAEYAYSAPPTALVWLSLIVAAGVVLASIWSRRYAWRAWAILAGWLAAADIVPVLLGRITELGPTVLGLETRYVADAVPVLAICLGLAFWPVARRPDTARRRVPVAERTQMARMVAAGLVGAFIIGSVWSVQAFENVTTSLPDQIFLANARVAVAQAPSGTVVADEPVPPALMLGSFGEYANASRVIGPLESASAGRKIRWIERPDGTIDHLMVFGSDGRLHLATVYGPPSVPLAAGRGCQQVSHGRAVVRFTSATSPNTKVLHLAYLAAKAVSGDDLTVSYGRTTQQFPVEPGLHDAYVTVRGSAGSVTISGTALGGLCVGAVQAGIIIPATSGPVIPAAY